MFVAPQVKLIVRKMPNAKAMYFRRDTATGLSRRISEKDGLALECLLSNSEILYRQNSDNWELSR